VYTPESRHRLDSGGGFLLTGKRERTTNLRVALVLLGMIGTGLQPIDFPRIGSQRLATGKLATEPSRYCKKPLFYGHKWWRARRDSNSRPSDSKS
jgi:hypothetical protein